MVATLNAPKKLQIGTPQICKSACKKLRREMRCQPKICKYICKKRCPKLRERPEICKKSAGTRWTQSLMRGTLQEEPYKSGRPTHASVRRDQKAIHQSIKPSKSNPPIHQKAIHRSIDPSIHRSIDQSSTPSLRSGSITIQCTGYLRLQ